MHLKSSRPLVSREGFRFLALAACLAGGTVVAQAEAPQAQTSAPGDQLLVQQAPAAAAARPATLPASDDVGPAKLAADRRPRTGSDARPLPYTAAGIAVKSGGLLKRGSNEKIVGGTQAAPGSYPFQAAIIRVATTNGKVTGVSPVCGGTVLTSRWILSAAHCFVEGAGGKVEGLRSTKNLLVHVGNTSLLAEDDERDWIPIKRIIAHPKYVTGTNVNDIALVELERAPKRGVKVQQVTVVTRQTEASDLPEQAELRIIGWGTTAEGGRPSPDLLETRLTAVDRNRCNRVLTSALVGSPDARRALEDLSYVFNLTPAARKTLEQQLPQIGGVVTPQMFCAGAAVDGVDTCQGDSGGPILSQKGDGPLVQVGIVSFGLGCGHAEFPGVYTRLALYIDWIKASIAPPSPPPAAPANPQVRR
ncbi:serine protease [Xanthobacter sp. AM11]|uniref:serine protease n=1 Tax=Xanthobacter sp. AM11 TaxID=3380643 RepID=UPI0039BF8C09